MEILLPDLAINRELQITIDRNIRKWARSSSLIDLLARKSQKSTQFVSPVANFICEKVVVQSNKAGVTKMISELPLTLLPSTISSSKVSAEFEKWLHGKKNRDEKVEEDKVQKHNHRYQGRKYSSSCGTSSIRPLLPPSASGTKSFLTQARQEKNTKKGNLIEAELSVLQFVQQIYVTAFVFFTYRLANISTK